MFSSVIPRPLSSRRLALLVFVAGVSILGVYASTLAATEPAPAQYTDNNPTCRMVDAQLAGDQTWLQVSTETSPQTRDYAFPGVGIVTLKVYDSTPRTFDWVSTFGVDAVIVKQAGAVHNVYVYAPTSGSAEALSGVGLHPILPPDSIGHVVFCYDAGTPSVESPTPGNTATPDPTETATPDPTETATPDPTGTPSATPTETVVPDPTETATPDPTETATPDPTETATTTPSATPPASAPLAPSDNPTSTPKADAPTGDVPATSTPPAPGEDEPNGDGPDGSDVPPTPPVELTAGERTPAPPRTGTGVAATEATSPISLLMGLAGLLATGAGVTALATSRRK